MFFWVKIVHVTSVALSLSLFFVRGLWMLSDPARLQRRWVRSAPHVIDTVLLLSGVTLAWLIRQYPPWSHWLDAKLLGLVLYIGLGTVALKRGPTRAVRAGAWVAALGVFGYIVSVAVTMNPAGFLLWLQ